MDITLHSHIRIYRHTQTHAHMWVCAHKREAAAFVFYDHINHTFQQLFFLPLSTILWKPLWEAWCSYNTFSCGWVIIYGRITYFVQLVPYWGILFSSFYFQFLVSINHASTSHTIVLGFSHIISMGQILGDLGVEDFVYFWFNNCFHIAFEEGLQSFSFPW